MPATKSWWKPGRGKLGMFRPLIGRWVAESKSDRGPMRCVRSFEEILGGKFVKLTADWHFGAGVYQEMAMFGVDLDGTPSFWSFTSDGKNSHGVVADVADLAPGAFGFEAQMPAGLARMAYWPEDDNVFRWVVEAKSAKGWKRFTEHLYRQLE